MELIPLEERKNKAIDALSAQYAYNELPLEEYERLAAYIHQAQTDRELAIIERIVHESALYARGPESPSGSAGYTRDSEAGFQPDSFAILSNRRLDDAISRGTRRFISILGHHEIFVEDLSPGKTEVEVLAILGDTVFRLAPHIRVRINALPILGNTHIAREIEKSSAYGGPELVIKGVALLSNITVKPLKKKFKFGF